ncbi:tyrosine-type recombinase/integrase [Tenuibacillus multivorans]|uniref:Integrase/recombinase XerD n=1 Tax=Tenuibacillus multivorans TaxID=237069 RepID=A0A1G9X7Y8_9BACI|nr:tyrosine-type recombinase/integrase [Tenuibacillus multivorans]GEL78673.1 integrase [Tenuibacillus multivorans]SDM92892.1 integrase/recombinase XerD [Tenuibacillus multivorans]
MEKYWELTQALPNAFNQEVIQDFLLSLKLANCSKHTILYYRRFLERFFSVQEESFTQLQPEPILKWFTTHVSHLKESSYRHKLDILSSFYNFCIQEEYLEQSPIKRRWFPRLPKSIPKYLDKEDIARIRQESENTLRNQVLVEFFLTTGCRVREVHELNREDVDLESRTACVRGKGRKIRYVHFTAKCALLLGRYMDTCPKQSPALFVTLKKGNRLSIRGIQETIYKIGKKAGLSTKLYPHRFRHTFATELLSKGAELSFIGDELGHADIGTTQIYARLPQREIVALYRKFMG